jgi:predicted nucleic acid-binding protein
VIHLDTSFLIHALAKGTLEDRRLRSWLAAARLLAISSPAWAEFLCGPVEDDHVTLALRVLGTPLPFADADARTTAWLFNQGGRRRGSLSDCMIAAVALNRRAQLATSNGRDFARFEAQGLAIVAIRPGA